MEVRFTADQKAFVREAIQRGRLHSEEEAVKEALSLWEERERTRGQVLAKIDAADASVVRGEGRIVTQESMQELAEEVKRRGHARFTQEQTAPR